MNAVQAVKAVLIVVGLILVGMIAWALVKALFGIVLYLLLGALVVGGGWYLYKNARTRRW